MILDAFGKALGQLGDARFQRVLWLGIGLTLLLLGLAYACLLRVLRQLIPGEVDLPWIGPVGGVETLVTWGSIPLMVLASVFLMVPVASAFCGIFLDDVAQAVEDRHYPALAPATPLPALTQVIEAVNFFGVIIAVNAVALVLALFTGPLAPLLFWAGNGYLLGREYFTLAATRRIGRPAARAMRQRFSGRIWLAGVLMTVPLTIPVVNFLVPILGAATFTHLFHRLWALAPSPPQSRNPGP